MLTYLITILGIIQGMVNDPALVNNPAALTFENQELVYVSQAISDIINQTSTVAVSQPVNQTVPQTNQGQTNFGSAIQMNKELVFNTENMGQYYNIYVAYKENGERKDADITLSIDEGVISGCSNSGSSVTCHTNSNSSNGAARFVYKIMDYTTQAPTKAPIGIRTLTATANGVTATTTIEVK